MCRPLLRLGIGCAALVLFASSAIAEPFQVVYRIDVLRRCEHGNGAETCRDFRASFPLTLTFDSQVINEHGNDADRTRFYGTPSVSDIPLPLRTDFPPLRETLRQAAERARFSAADNAWLRESNVLIRHGAGVGGSDFHRDFSLVASGEVASVPDLNAASFARFLGTAPFRQFALSDSIELSTGGFEALSYFGDVSLEAGPVPEPMSLLLVGSGLCGVAVQRWRRRRSVG